MNDRTVLHLERRVTDWLLADAPARARPVLLESTLSQVATTRQDRLVLIGLPWPGRNDEETMRWRSLGARRRLAAGALAVAVVGFALYGLVRLAPSFGPAATTRPSPTAVAAPERLLPTANGPLEAGRYAFASVFDEPVGIHFDVPDGWEQAGWAIRKTRVESYVSFWTVQTTYLDPCHWQTTATKPALGPSVEDLVTALRAQEGRTVTEPTPVVIGGYLGQSLALVVPDGIGSTLCDQGEYRNWVAPGSGDGSRFVPVQVGYAGYTDTVWILDVSGMRVVIDVTEAPTIDGAVRAEVRAIVDSIRFDDVSAGVRFGVCTLGVATHANSVAAVGGGWGADGPGRPEVSFIGPNGAYVLPGIGLSDGRLEVEQDLTIAGRWRLRVVAWGVGCLVDVPIDVLPVASG